MATVLDFIKANGCTCFRPGSDFSGETSFRVAGRKVILHPGVAAHTTEQMVRGTGDRPRVARWRRPWLRARRRAVRRTGKLPQNFRMTYVLCHGCGARAQTPEQLDDAF